MKKEGNTRMQHPIYDKAMSKEVRNISSEVLNLCILQFSHLKRGMIIVLTS